MEDNLQTIKTKLEEAAIIHAEHLKTKENITQADVSLVNQIVNEVLTVTDFIHKVINK